jgi:hypothetical protein
LEDHHTSNFAGAPKRIIFLEGQQVHKLRQSIRLGNKGGSSIGKTVGYLLLSREFAWRAFSDVILWGRIV